MNPPVALLLALSLLVAAAACSDRVRLAENFPSAAGAGGSLLSTGGAAGVAEMPACTVATCQGKVYACGDCLDNDADGLLDADDSECTGPCDNTEDSYYSGIPGANNAPCREDCYFDQDTGSGNDKCYWSQQCDPLALAPDYPPSGDARCAYDASTKIPGVMASCAELMASQEATCSSYCGPLVPNGCDAFGCCELPAGSQRYVWIGSTQHNVGSCTEAMLADPAACRPCTPVTATLNPCEACEVCVGRPKPLAECSTNQARCPASMNTCGQPGEAACVAGEYCITGCCAPSPK